MAESAVRDSEYVVLPEQKTKTVHRYEDDDDIDDDAESQVVTSERIIRARPAKERVKYITVKNPEDDYHRSRKIVHAENRIKVRQTKNGEQIVLDEDDNVIKVIRNTRTPSPPLIVGGRRLKLRSDEPRAVYYETPDGQVIVSKTKRPELARKKIEYVYSDDEAAKIIKKVVIDPKTGEQEVFYEREKPKKRIRPRVIVQKPVQELQVVSDEDDDGHVEYVQVVQRRPVAVQVASKAGSPSKYVMIRKKAEPEPIYETIPTIKHSPRIVYRTSPRKAPVKYIYTTDGKP